MSDTFSHRRLSFILLGILLAGFSALCATDWYSALPRGIKATFVGRDSCMRCHVEQERLWHGSDHDRAMELAKEGSVLGDFNNATFTWQNVTTRFFRRDEKYMVNTEGPDGQLDDFEIKYTFGVDPLQQYMVEFPDGRVQVLTVSWDIRKNEWFMVTPPDVPDERILPGDPLHWTGVAQNWNTMCAECHSTDVHKSFDLETNSYHTTFAEIDVSCETCHGPGSIHVQLADARSLFWDRHLGYGLPQLKNATALAELETCAPCHSRRSQIHPDYHTGEGFLDLYRPSLLEAGLYYPDGQIRDEVYVYGSFQQSKMFAKGVRCVDCHDPHSLNLKYEGNRLCTQCHQPGIYDGPNHHHHLNEGPATQCVTCHMPTNTYMVVDDRHDHSMRIPRPDLSDALSTPNACTQCHDRPEETNSWAAQAIRQWYGEKRPGEPSFGEALLAGQLGLPEGLQLIRKLAKNKSSADIVRATAVSLLRRYPSQDTDALCREMMKDESPLVRSAAIGAMSEGSLPTLVLEAERHLDDPVRVVRIAAASRLVEIATEVAKSRYREALDKAILEYKDSNELGLDRAASHINLAMLEYALGNNSDAQMSLATAIRLEPYLTGPRELLARILTELGGDSQEISRLREEEVQNLRRDAEILPNNAQIPYRRGMLLYLLGRQDAARDAFEKACKLDPNSYDNWLALALICEAQQKWNRANEALQYMDQLRPNDQAVRGIRHRIQKSRAGEKKVDSAASE